MLSVPRPFLARGLEILLVVSILGMVLGIILFVLTPNIGIHRDEPLWLTNSYTLVLFAQGDFSSPGWEESHTILRHPTLTSFIIGVGQLAGGYNIAEFDELARSVVDPQDKTILKGEIARALIDSRLIWWSRLPMAVLMLLCGMLLFKLVRTIAGRLAAYTVLALFAINPFLLKTLGRALSETPLLLFLLLSTVAAERALRCWGPAIRGTQRQRIHCSLLWFLLLGVFAGLATACKLNGATLALGGIGLAVIIGLQRLSGSPGARLGFVLGAGGLLLLGQILTFIALNPYLYPDISQRISAMVSERLEVIEIQKQRFAHNVIPDLPTRLTVVPQRVLERYAALHFPGAWLLNGVLTGAGLWYLARSSWRWARFGDGEPAAIALLASAIVMAGPPLLTPLDWDRYYLFPVIFSSICIAIGGAWIASALATNVKQTADRLRRSSEPPQS